MKKAFISGIIGLIIGSGIGYTLGYVLGTQRPVVDEFPRIIEDTFQEIQKEQDSLQMQIIKTDTVIQTIYREYEKDTAIIINQSVSEDIEFFANYLSKTA